MKKAVLVVEDEAHIAGLVELYLGQAGFHVRWVTLGSEAVKAVEDPSVALVLLDLNLPDADGVDVFRRIQRVRELPVIMMTARDSEADRVLGLELGADDYVTKPFSPRELVARVKAVQRRSEPREAEGSVVIGELRIDPASRTVALRGEPIEVTRMEFDLLAWLAARAGRVFTRAQLLEAVWGYPEDIDSRTVDVHIAQLRRKLGDACPLRTVRGVGYKAQP